MIRVGTPHGGSAHRGVRVWSAAADGMKPKSAAASSASRIRSCRDVGDMGQSGSSTSASETRKQFHVPSPSRVTRCARGLTCIQEGQAVVRHRRILDRDQRQGAHVFAHVRREAQGDGGRDGRLVLRGRRHIICANTQRERQRKKASGSREMRRTYGHGRCLRRSRCLRRERHGVDLLLSETVRLPAGTARHHRRMPLRLRRARAVVRDGPLDLRGRDVGCERDKKRRFVMQSVFLACAASAC